MHYSVPETWDLGVRDHCIATRHTDDGRLIIIFRADAIRKPILYLQIYPGDVLL